MPGIENKLLQISGVSDSEIFFVLQVYQDTPFLARCFKDLRKHYPQAQVLVISDGDPDPAIADLCARFSVKCEYGERLFGADKGGQASQRFMEKFLQSQARYMVKIDPDTHLRRRFKRWPMDVIALFGTTQLVHWNAEVLVSLQGGCFIVPRVAAEFIVKSGRLLDPKLKPPALVWAIHPTLRQRAGERGLTSHDWPYGYVCRELGVPLFRHPEISSWWKGSFRQWLASWIKNKGAVHPRLNFMGKKATS